MKIAKKKSSRKNVAGEYGRKVNGTASRPRVTVCFTNQNIHAQCIDDVAASTLFSASTNDKGSTELLPNIAGATKLGSDFADKLKKGGVKSIVFDRAGKKYHGCVKAFAESLRGKGLEF